MTRDLLAPLMGLVLASSSCSAADSPPESAATGGSSAQPEPAKNPLGRERCRAPSGVSASPRDTQEALLLLNALPKPTSVACFLESLSRPLSIQATSSIFSAQPALSALSPRVFIKLGQGWLSVVIDGDSSYLLEFGDVLDGDPSRSVKGELELPLLEPAAPSAPYDRVMFNDTTTSCGFCHFNERIADNLSFPNAFASVAFQPRLESLVSTSSLRSEHERCDWQREPHRCDMLASIFDGGEVREEPFPSSLATFF